MKKLIPSLPPPLPAQAATTIATPAKVDGNSHFFELPVVSLLEGLHLAPDKLLIDPRRCGERSQHGKHGTDEIIPASHLARRSPLTTA